MIFEDDIELETAFIDKLNKCIAELPEDWNMLYLNCTEGVRSLPYSANLKRVSGAWGAFGYLVNANMYDELISGLESAKLAVDDYYKSLHGKVKAFRTAQPLCWHIKGYSYRQDKEVEYLKVEKQK